VLLEVAGELARRGERQLELARELADAPLSLGPYLREDRDVAAAERRVALDEREQVGRRPPARPEPAHHAAECVAQRGQLSIGYHSITITPSERKEVRLQMCGRHHHRLGRRGFPSREQLVERLEGYREHLQDELKNVEELLQRLADEPQQTTTV
jgi:hypothetical protein